MRIKVEFEDDGRGGIEWIGMILHQANRHDHLTRRRDRGVTTETWSMR
jgi:hypothetical protein